MGNELKRELLLTLALGEVGLACFALIITLQQQAQAALLWLALSSVLWAFVWQQCWQHRSLNRLSENAALLPKLGLANELSLFRGWLIAATGGFLTLQSIALTIPALLYTIAAICDRLDGWLARRSGQCTLLGATLDTRYDALGLVIAPLLAIVNDKLSNMYLLVSLAYYAFVAGLWWRRRHNKPVFPLHPSALRRTLAGMQMGFVAVALWPALAPSVTQTASLAFMLPLLIGFGVDWLVVSGHIVATGSVAQFLYQRLPKLSSRWLLPLLRLSVVLLFVNYASKNLLSLMNSNPVSHLAVYSAALLVLSVVGIGLGIAARICSALLLLLLATQSSLNSPSTLTLLLIFTTVLVLLLGSGAFSLWQQDQAWIERQDGA